MRSQCYIPDPRGPVQSRIYPNVASLIFLFPREKLGHTLPWLSVHSLCVEHRRTTPFSPAISFCSNPWYILSPSRWSISLKHFLQQHLGSISEISLEKKTKPALSAALGQYFSAAVFWLVVEAQPQEANKPSNNCSCHGQ